MLYATPKNTTALLIIDAQAEYFSPAGALYTENSAKILQPLIALRNAAHSRGLMTVLVQHVHRASGVDVGRMGDFDDTEVFVEGTPGVDIIEDLAPTSQDCVVRKTRYSAFEATELNALLRGNGIDTVVIAGMMTQYCSVTTARHAHDLDYKVIFVSDGNAGPDLPDLGFGELKHEDAMRTVCTMLAGGVADVATSEEVCQSILKSE
ncbi:hypothetical protein CR973_00655 [Candidatus Saccharibacteria bacterium]|nr:MAG: hypothetical protein CR973_00655 [Candidatus Saccharibacteria bacterium]